jgi:hypothetical protein
MSAAVLSETSRWPLRLGQLTLLGWLAYLLVAPTIGFSWIDSWHNEQRAVQVVLLAWTALVFATIVIFDGAALRVAKGVAPLLAAFVLLGAASAARSAHPLAAFAEISMLVLLAALAVLTAIVGAAAPERTAAIARYFALLFCAAYSLGVAVRLFAALQLGHAIGLDVLVFGYANPRFPMRFTLHCFPWSRWLRSTSAKRGRSASPLSWSWRPSGESTGDSVRAESGSPTCSHYLRWRCSSAGAG